MDWDKLRIFQAAADAGSFTRAGETLGLSSRQSAGRSAPWKRTSARRFFIAMREA